MDPLRHIRCSCATAGCAVAFCLRRVDREIAQVKAEIEANALTADAEKKFGKFGFGVKRAHELHPAI